MKRFLAILLLLVAPLAHATFDCIPKTTITPNASGTQLRYAQADTGVWINWWCVVPPKAGQDPTKTWWRQQAWAALTKYQASNPNPISTLYSIATAADPILALNAADTASTVVPVVGSIDEYNYKTLIWSACKALVTAPLDIPNPDPIDPNYCGAQPVAPPPGTITPVYVVTPSGTSTIRQAFIAIQNPDGSWTRSISSTGNATVGATCDCTAIQILQFGARYCKVDVPGATTPMVTACTLKK